MMNNIDEVIFATGYIKGYAYPSVVYSKKPTTMNASITLRCTHNGLEENDGEIKC